jgi:hypothetical protein
MGKTRWWWVIDGRKKRRRRRRRSGRRRDDSATTTTLLLLGWAKARPELRVAVSSLLSLPSFCDDVSSSPAPVYYTYCC